MATSKVKIKNLDKVMKRINKVFDDSIKRESFLIDVRDFVVRRIKGETRKGFDLSRDGAPQPELSSGYISIREKIASGAYRMKPRPRSSFFKPAFSNLTSTGQLLDSVIGKMKVRKAQIEVTVDGERKPTTITNAKTGKPISFGSEDEITTNKGLVRKLSDSGRTFLGLDDKGVQRVRKMVLDEIRRKIKESRFVAKP